jgi:nucleoside-diphosphate-sugar epimerase
MASRGNGPAVTCLRLATLYGVSPRMRFDLVVNIMAARALRERRVPLYGGSQWRPLVHAADAAEAFARVLEAPVEIVGDQVFNVGSDDQNFRVAELARRVASAFDVRIEQHPPSQDDLRNYRVSFEKIQHHLGFRTSCSVEDACREVTALLADEAVDHRDDRFHNHRYPYSIDPRQAPPFRTTLRSSDEEDVATRRASA